MGGDVSSKIKEFHGKAAQIGQTNTAQLFPPD
jgi:hypothetical protein